MAHRLGRLFAGRSGMVVLVAAVAVVAAGGTAAGLALTSNSGPELTPSSSSMPATMPMSSSSSSSTTSTSPSTTSTTPVTAAPAAGSTPAATTTVSKIISDTCLYSHEANDDPILDPGRTGQSMAHDFFGNATTSASSTASNLVGGSTTCSTSVDASAYWTPVLYQNGVAVTPVRNLIYWAGLQATDPTVSVPPAGLEMIAGNENAMAPQSTRAISWRCANEDETVQALSAVPVNCPGTKGIELRVTFPSCWNGVTLNGASQTNVVYPVKGTCPAADPVRIPVVIFHVIYPITSAAGLTLSMGPGQQGSTDTAHGDFISGWDQSVLTSLINGCAGSSHTCGHVSGVNAQVRPRQA
jgi:Domain of unknown function (DUF1996)